MSDGIPNKVATAGNTPEANNGKDISNKSLEDKLADYQAQIEQLENRRRDTQSAYTKERQAVLRLEAEIAVLRQELAQAKVNDPELEQLKYTNPDEWYARLQEQQKLADSNRKTKIDELTNKNLADFNAQIKKDLLEVFNNKYPDANLTEDFLANEIPMRIKDLEAKGNYEDFLKSAYEWRKAVVIGSKSTELNKKDKEPNLTNLGGSSNPPSNAVDTQKQLDFIKTYGF